MAAVPLGCFEEAVLAVRFEASTSSLASRKVYSKCLQEKEDLGWEEWERDFWLDFTGQSSVSRSPFSEGLSGQSPV